MGIQSDCFQFCHNLNFCLWGLQESSIGWSLEVERMAPSTEQTWETVPREAQAPAESCEALEVRAVPELCRSMDLTT